MGHVSQPPELARGHLRGIAFKVGDHVGIKHCHVVAHRDGRECLHGTETRQHTEFGRHPEKVARAPQLSVLRERLRLRTSRHGDLFEESMNIVGPNLVTPFFVLHEQPDGAEIVKGLLRGADPKAQAVAPIRNGHPALGERDQRANKIKVTQPPVQRRLDLVLPSGRRVSSGERGLQVLCLGEIVIPGGEDLKGLFNQYALLRDFLESIEGISTLVERNLSNASRLKRSVRNYRYTIGSPT
jgi:hypothetical protein